MEEETLISIPDFINITRISERDVLKLLGTGELDVQLGSLGEVLIDISEVTPEKLAATHPVQQQDAEVADPLVVEAVASELVAALDPILDEALALALKWHKAEQAGE